MTSLSEEKKDDAAPLVAPVVLSPEDQVLKDRLSAASEIVLSLTDTLPFRVTALKVLAVDLQTATSSMTAVPKPLKFLRSTYKAFVDILLTTEEGAFKSLLAEVVSVLSITSSKLEGEVEPTVEPALVPLPVLRYRLLAGPLGTVTTWGGEYLRTLSGEISQAYNARIAGGDAGGDDLKSLVEEIVPYMLKHHSDSDALDLLIETNNLQFIVGQDYVDASNVKRIGDYIVKTSGFMLVSEGRAMLEVARDVYGKCGFHTDALRVQMKLGYDAEVVERLLGEAEEEDKNVAKQMCLLLARCRSKHETEVGDDLDSIISNETLSDTYLALGRDLDVVDAKTPEDIYKSHLGETAGFKRGKAKANVDSARGNLASTFVNGFVNAGFGHDTLMTPADSDWLYKNKGVGMLSATASLGWVMLWNVEGGLTVIDKFLYSSEENVKAGAALAVGVVSSGIRNEADPALALLSEHVEGPSGIMKLASVEALGIAYAGSGREDIVEVLVGVLEGSEDMNEICMAALSLGQVCVGTADDTAASAIVQKLMEFDEEQSKHAMAKFLCLGLGLLFLEKGEEAEAIGEAVKTVEFNIGKLAGNTIEMCAFAGSGQVLKVQSMLHECSEHLAEDADHQAVAAIGIAMITMGEEIGREMAVRTFDHLLHYSELPIKRVVPLALALLHVSNPEYTIVDQLSRLSHDQDDQVSQNAIMALGIISAGTNNSRVAGLLRGLGEFYAKEAGQMFCVRIAQGLLHMGKGLITLAPYHSDKLLMSGPAVGGILTVLFSCLDMKNTLLDKAHHLLFYLTGAMNPRMLVTVNSDLEMKPVTVRVGTAVETVAQPGKPRGITGFQTHSSPVLLHTNERAELGTEEFKVVAGGGPLEGIVIVEENPDWKEEGTDDKK